MTTPGIVPHTRFHSKAKCENAKWKMNSQPSAPRGNANEGTWTAWQGQRPRYPFSAPLVYNFTPRLAGGHSIAGYPNRLTRTEARAEAAVKKLIKQGGRSLRPPRLVLCPDNSVWRLPVYLNGVRTPPVGVMRKIVPEPSAEFVTGGGLPPSGRRTIQSLTLIFAASPETIRA